MTTRCRSVLLSVAMFIFLVSSASGTEDECEPVYQSVSDKPMVSSLNAYGDNDNARLKVCGASPACSSCQEIALGDCRYVFPTYVMAYPRKNNDGSEAVCACQVFACKLPWDPLDWSGQCMSGGELGCYTKPANRGAEAFPQSMCTGVDESIRVKFVPMAFALQDYTRPGIRVIVYKGEKVIRKEYIFPRVGSFHNITDNAVSKRLKAAVMERKRELDKNLYLSSCKYGDECHQAATRDRIWNLIDVHAYNNDKGDNTLAVDQATHTYTALRGEDDSVCIRYYGTHSKGDSLPLVSTCLPIPGLDSPTMYALSERHSNGLVIVPCHIAMKNPQGSLWQHLSFKYNADTKGLQCVGPMKVPEDLFYSAGSRPTNTNAGKEDCLLRLNDGDGGDDYKAGKRFLGYQVWVPNNIRESWLRYGIFLDYARTLCRVASFPPLGLDKGSNTSPAQSCVYSNSFYNSHKVFPNSTPAAKDYVGEKQSGVVCADGVIHRDIELEVIRECHGGEECASTVIPSGIIRGRLVQGAVASAGESASIGAYEQLGAVDAPRKRYTSFRVRKKPKTLRRYVIVNYGGIDRRIRCDDRYSIDLHSVSQEVLDQSQVNDNKFVFPKAYLGNSVRDDSRDLCNSSGSNIVYYYEGGGFVANSTGSEECGNPVEEYYAPDKKVRGCEYEYIRTDNYKPFFPGVGATSHLASFPVSVYEQGLCVDGFEKSWFRPDYYTAHSSGKDWGVVGNNTKTCCQWKNDAQVALLRARSTAITQERSVYRYRLQKSKESSKQGATDVCTLYRVEMWGGGESATTTALGVRRSGRPGQYTMVLLDYNKLQGKEARDSRPEPAAGYRQRYTVEDYVLEINKASQHSLVFKIGEGGKQGQKKGDDTVLRLCSDAFFSRHNGHLGSDVWWDNVFSDTTVVNGGGKSYPVNGHCYEIARAVGGGSEKAGELQYDIAKDIVVYYKTISGDVLEGDDGAQYLLESGNAMFTKFPLEMNLSAKPNGTGDGPMEKVMSNRRFFEGRSLPREFCQHKSDRRDKYPDESGGVFIPGMGGCWDSDKSNPGVGENGAVMITCERWIRDAAQSAAK